MEKQYKVEINNHPLLGRHYWQEFSEGLALPEDKAKSLAKEIRADPWCPCDEAVRVVEIMKTENNLI